MPPATSQKLKAVPSDPDKVDWTIGAGRSAVACVQAGQWYCPDNSQPKYLWYWLNEYVDFVLGELNKNAQVEFPNHVPRFFKYLTIQLMKSDTLKVLRYFQPQLSNVKQRQPVLLHPCTYGILALVDFGVEAIGCPDLSTCGIELNMYFVELALYEELLQITGKQ